MTDGMTPLFDRILDMPKPTADVESSTQLLVANIDFDQYKGKLGIGRLTAGKLRAGQTVGAQLGPEGERRNVQVKEVFIFDNLGRKQVDEATAGEIVMFSGVTDIGIADDGSERAYVKFAVPTRGMIGLRNQLLTATRGTAVIDTVFDSYKPNVGVIASRDKGSLLAYESGEATSYGITGAQDRGQLFCEPKTKVYKDMIVGVHQRPGDLRVNVCKQKQLTNMRSATKGIVEGLSPPLELTLDSAVEYISEEELVEVTPESIRMAKQRGWDAKGKGQKAKGSS